MADIFLSYRRADARWAAGRICDRLLAEFGEESVFLDTVALEPGEDFVEAIGSKVEGCRTLLAVIGPKWLETLGAKLNQPNDYVRIELSQALARGLRIIPLTIDDVAMPSEAELPKELAMLARRNALPVRADTFRADIAVLIKFLKQFFEQPAPAAADKPVPIAATERAASVGSASDFGLKHRTEHWKPGSGGRALRKIFVWLEASPAHLDSVKRVVYKLHPTFKNPTREIFDRESKFELRTNGWGEFEIKAEVYSKDDVCIASLTQWISFT